ncbi:MAG: gamma-glutamyltransferase [Gammaproteobacteria bacterium]|nr:MAG: gamma-glutamyltransferase [Gammaproteobacteria bacterium]TDJ37663.1 MAG: gamma-glutamyltransferase [Gammaproteobacteria bacterium]
MYITAPRLLLLAATLLANVVSAASPEAVHGQRGMVASRSMLASEVGARIMRDGGNAIDAAVATGFAIAVTYPSAGNLGGGGFMVIRLADGTVVTNDHRERAPGAAHRDMYLDEAGQVVQGASTTSHLAAGVPGTVAGLLDVLERYGTVSRKQALAPAIELARGGFLLSYDLARNLGRRADTFRRYPGSAAQFLQPDGTTFATGDRFRQPDLARTLTRISDQGRDGFYKGETADLIVAEMQRGNGLINHEDLTSYRSVWREPIAGRYRGHEIYSMPPPSSGGVLIVQMLNMLEPFDLAAMGYGSAARAHLLIEAERRAYADRAEHMGDPDFYPVPVHRLIDPGYARTRFADFNVDQASRSQDIGAGQWPSESPETTHISVLDAAGNAVAFTTTLNLSFGSKIVVQGAGFLLNNEMDDFSVKEDTPNAYGLIGRKANAIEPGKRMLSSMSPTVVVKDGKPLLVTGSPGGATIITTVLQVIVNVIDHNMDVSDAVAAPRFHHQWQPDRIIYEPYAFSPDTLRVLDRLGHKNLQPWTYGRGIGDANSVMGRNGELLGVNDPRNDGGSVGF